MCRIDQTGGFMDTRDHGPRRGRIVVTGPFAPFADGLRQDLARQGRWIRSPIMCICWQISAAGWRPVNWLPPI
jgi:hypothetical protein